MSRIKYPQLLLIAGSGQNVGKTTLACEIIGKFSENRELIGVKISPHFHTLTTDSQVIERNNRYILVEETRKKLNKDSGRMLQSGASKAYFIMVRDDSVHSAFKHLLSTIGNHHLFICESGGLAKYIEAGLFLYIQQAGSQVANAEKKDYRQRADKIVTYNGRRFDFQLDDIQIHNNQWKIKGYDNA